MPAPHTARELFMRMMSCTKCRGNLPRFQEPLQLEIGWAGRYPRCMNEIFKRIFELKIDNIIVVHTQVVDETQQAAIMLVVWSLGWLLSKAKVFEGERRKTSPTMLRPFCASKIFAGSIFIRTKATVGHVIWRIFGPQAWIYRESVPSLLRCEVATL